MATHDDEPQSPLPMRLWHLKVTDKIKHPTNFSFVIRAESEEDARHIADYQSSGLHGSDPGYENECVSGGHAWLKNEYTTCEELTADGDEGVINVDSRY